MPVTLFQPEVTLYHMEIKKMLFLECVRSLQVVIGLEKLYLT